MLDDYRYSHMAKGKGQNYDNSFRKYSYRNILWSLEKKILENILRDNFSNKKVNYLDFACGTGRVISHLCDKVGNATGVDISNEMLKVARINVKNAVLIEADITNKDVLGETKFDLITAFRFFPNAQSELREEAIKLLAKHLKNDGVLVLNNHRNASSLYFRVLSLLNKSNEGEGMTEEDIHKLLDSACLKIKKKYGIGILPIVDNYSKVPKFIVLYFEKIFMNLGLFKKLCQNNIYVCSK